MVMEKMNEALEELKRVDHLIYVSLKYTRTVDVILNIINRMVDAYSLIVDALLLNAEEKNKLISSPESAIERAEAVRSVYRNDDTIVDNVGLYILLRKLLRARHIERENEYRRHVTMKTIIEGREEIVNIDIITNYYLFQRDFIIHSKNIFDGNFELELEEQEIGRPPEPEWMHEPAPETVIETRTTRKIPTRTPPTKAQVKVRPITSAPRKRTPRPKKYKIQIPKEPNPIMRPPFEHDPKYNPELRKKLEEAEKAKQKAARKKTKKAPKKTKQRTVKRKVRKRPTRKKIARKKSVKRKVVRKKTRKRVVKKKVVKRKVRKRSTRKKAVKKTKKKATRKTVRKKPAKRKTSSRLVRKFKRAVRKAVKR